MTAIQDTPPTYHLLVKPLESHRTPEVTIAWQGGEPTLMGLEFFKQSINYIEKHKKPGQ